MHYIWYPLDHTLNIRKHPISTSHQGIRSRYRVNANKYGAAIINLETYNVTISVKEIYQVTLWICIHKSNEPSRTYRRVRTYSHKIAHRQPQLSLLAIVPNTNRRPYGNPHCIFAFRIKTSKLLSNLIRLLETILISSLHTTNTHPPPPSNTPSSPSNTPPTLLNDPWGRANLLHRVLLFHRSLKF